MQMQAEPVVLQTQDSQADVLHDSPSSPGSPEAREGEAPSRPNISQAQLGLTPWRIGTEAVDVFNQRKLGLEQEGRSRGEEGLENGVETLWRMKRLIERGCEAPLRRPCCLQPRFGGLCCCLAGCVDELHDKAFDPDGLIA